MHFFQNFSFKMRLSVREKGNCILKNYVGPVWAIPSFARKWVLWATLAQGFARN